jgi:hypothetical protein
MKPKPKLKPQEKIPPSLRGKYVSRAVYAKLQAENHRLMEDIRLMSVGGVEGGVTWTKWRKHFKSKDQFMQVLRSVAQKEFPKGRKTKSGTKAVKSASKYYGS